MIKSVFLADLVLSISSVYAVVDEPFSKGMVYDVSSNMIVVRGNEGRYIQSFSHNEEYIFFEAEDMNATGSYINAEWVATRVGYPNLFPSGLPTELPRPVANVAPYLSGTGVAAVMPGTGRDAIVQQIEIKRGGKCVLWVRYQTIKQLPAPFEVVIEQSGKELLRKVFNEESKALDVRSARLMWEPTGKVELKPGKVTIRLIKVKDKNPGPLRGTRFVDCFLLTNDLNYIPAGKDLLPSIDGVKKRMRLLGLIDGRKKVALWSKPRYGDFGISFWPTDKSQLDPVFNFRLPRNSHGSELLLVTSLCNKPVTFTADVKLVDKSGKTFPGKIQIRVVAQMHSRYFGWVPNTLFRREKITVSPYQTTGLWVSVSTGQSKPGLYTGKIIIRNDKASLGTVPIKLKIMKASVYEDPDLRVLLWSGGVWRGYPKEQQPEMEKIYWSDENEHGQNVARSASTWTADEARKRGVKTVFVYPRYTRESAGSEKWKKIVTNLLQKRIKKLKDKGWREDEIWFQAYDEPNAGSCEKWLKYAKLAKKIAPKMKIWINPGWQRGQTEEAFRKWEKYVDIWWPFAGNFTIPGLLKVMKQSGKPIGFYIERGWHGPNPAASWSYFRKMPMLVAKYDITGCGFWASTAYYGDPWNDFDTHPNYAEAAVYYPGNEGPIDTINFEAWREGLDELLMVRYLAEKGKINQIEWAKKFLVANSPDEQNKLRNILLDLMEKNPPK